ncbi:MAG TPA: redoxin domain-containing protein, partial [Bacteroidia bacterium]|nr:redoxin domain-containing protein [Bacteroidia bacterium]
QNKAGAIFSVIAFFFAMKEVSKYTSNYQFFTVFAAAFLTGIALEYPFATFPFLTIVLLFTAACCTTRIVFFSVFSYTQYSWLEPILLFCALIFFSIGIFNNHYPIFNILVPIPNIAFSGMITFGILKDKKQLMKNVSAKRRVEIGKVPPDFELPDQENKIVKLSDFKEERHLLLIFVRGDWCPGCHMMLRTYEKSREKFQDKNIFVMAIGPDPVGVNKEMVIKLGLDFKVLADEKQKTAMAYGVQLKEYDHAFAETYKEGIPLPASFLIDKTGIVRYVSRPDKVGEFLNPSLIFPIIEQLN